MSRASIWQPSDGTRFRTQAAKPRGGISAPRSVFRDFGDWVLKNPVLGIAASVREKGVVPPENARATFPEADTHRVESSSTPVGGSASMRPVSPLSQRANQLYTCNRVS